MRSWLIEWVAVVLADLVTDESVRQLEGSVALLREQDYSLNWHRLLPLDAGLFALTDDHTWLDHCRANVDHGNSNLREVALQSLSLVADRLPFFDSELQDRIRSNFERRQLFSGSGVILLAATNGPIEDKLYLFRHWLSLGYHGFEHDTLTALTSGKSMENEFGHHWAGVTQYVTQRLGNVIASTGTQRSLFDEQRAQPEGKAIPTSLMMATYFALELTGPVFSLEKPA